MTALLATIAAAAHLARSSGAIAAVIVLACLCYLRKPGVRMSIPWHRLELGQLRVWELHHLYYGMALLAWPATWTPFEWHWLPSACWCVGWVLVADELTQHGWQTVCQATGRACPDDFTPIHEFGRRLLGAILTTLERHPHA